jgi:hypothetical protein
VFHSDISLESWSVEILHFRHAIAQIEVVSRRASWHGLSRSPIITPGDAGAASAVLCTILESAPPGFAGWTALVEPFLLELQANQSFARARQILADRAR